ncbi:unnamed protein product, partial [Didymodactylos carnosus]
MERALFDNDAYGAISFILTIVFVCIAAVLLINVLVALFKIEKLDKDKQADEAWAYHRFLLYEEYSRISILPPPFSVIQYLGELILTIMK